MPSQIIVHALQCLSSQMKDSLWQAYVLFQLLRVFFFLKSGEVNYELLLNWINELMALYAA